MYLEKVNYPEDLKKLDLKKLPILSDEIRKFLINAVSETGGHLSSNLGVVELTVALHYCFNCPKDKIVWDVGHQSYTHKILTGRKNEFSTLRKKDGLSGFPRIGESEYDTFSTGHSSTSIAVALGIAKARDLKRQNYNVLAVIGDGAMTGGLAYEALNNACKSNTKMVIILNDNQMSISPNVGAMSQYLSNLRTTQKYLNAKDDIQHKLNSMPVIGKPIYNFLDKTKNTVKHTIMPNNVFEALGIRYIGPVDGHDITQLVHVFNRIKNLKGPVLIHVMTKKGKGYKPAEINPSVYHGVGKFDKEVGVIQSSVSPKTYSKILGEKLLLMAAYNKKICAITAAMPESTGLGQFAKTYPERFFDVGIAEEYAVTFSSGLAVSGYVPVFAVYSTFLQRAYDQILHDVCLSNLHTVFCIDRAGIVGSDGETHQGIYDISFLLSIPNLVILAPKNGKELEDMFEYAVNKLNCPVAIRYPRGKASEVLNDVNTPIELGKSEIIYEGTDIAIVSFGAMMDVAIDVYSDLKEKGYNPTLINARFAYPMDSECIKSLAKNHRYIYTLEDNILSGGFGEHFTMEIVNSGEKSCSVFNFAFPNAYIEQGSREQLFEKYGMDKEHILEKILKRIED